MHNRLRLTPIIAILAGLMLTVALACAGDSATPTTQATSTSPAPTATSVPTGPTATAPAGSTATAVPVPTEVPTGTWMDRYLQSPGYKPEWGEPKTGGIFKWRVSRNNSNFSPNMSGTTHGLFNMPRYNSLIRFDPWVGFTSIIPDLAKSWEWSDDFLTLTLKLEEGVMFQNNPDVPETYNGGKVRGDEFTCEDIGPSVERHARPPEWETTLTKGPRTLWHLQSVTCPDGPLGYTTELHFELPLGKTMAALAQGLMVMLDKDWIEWYNTEHPAGMTLGTNEAFHLGMGAGPYIPGVFKADIVGEHRRNPDYFREGLPLADGIDVVILKDFTTAFTALATGQIHVMGRGSWSLTPAQVGQAIRDFPDKIEIHPNLHLFGYGVGFNVARAPFDNPKVRQAIQIAMDRDEWLLLREAGPLAGGKIMGALTGGTIWSHTDDELRTWPGIRDKQTPEGQADIADANTMLDEVFGVGERFSMTCMASGVEYVEDCLLFADQMKKFLDIDVTMESVEPAVGTQRSNAGAYDVNSGAVGSNTEIGDPDDYFLSNWSTRYGANSASTLTLLAALAQNEPELMMWIEDTIDEQSRELDTVKRKALVNELGKTILIDVARKIPFGQRMSFPGSGPAVKGYRLFDLSLYSNWSIWERVWLDE